MIDKKENQLGINQYNISEGEKQEIQNYLADRSAPFPKAFTFPMISAGTLTGEELANASAVEGLPDNDSSDK